jgi:hypothetical protein
MKYFKWSFIFTAISLLIGFFLWFSKWLNIISWLEVLLIIVILWILEISLSFDNAIVNAKILAKMDKKRQKRFLTRWIAIAVFGMRIIFPLIIVAIVWKINPIQALNLALFDQDTYAKILQSSHFVIAWFGWAFLMMVWFNFFLDKEKNNHRIWSIEKFLKKIWELESIWIVLTLILLFFFSRQIDQANALSFITSGLRWIVIYVLIEWISKTLQKKENAITNTAKVWLSLFIYLEILDASFSFDWVIWAFAISKNIIIIALWLGIGAMFVRSLTIMMVKKWTLSKYKYLEHGAFRAILCLAMIMFINTIYEVPEIITWWLWAWFIIVSFWHSIRAIIKEKN